MNFKTTIVLVMLAVIVGVFFYFQLGRSSPQYNPTGEEGQSGTALFSPGTLSAQNVSRIKVTHDDKIVVLTERAGQWRQTQPVTFGISTSAAQGLIDDASQLHYQESFTPGQADAPTLAQAGLAPPRAVVTFTTDQGKTHSLKLGRLIGGQGYVQFDDAKPVRVVTDTLHKAVFDHDINDWRDKALAMPQAGAVEKLTVTGTGKAQPVALVKAGDQWFLDAHARQRADADAVDGLIAAAGNLRVKDFVNDHAQDPSRYGLAKPRLVLTITHAVAGAGGANHALGQDKPNAKSKEKNTSQASDEAKPQSEAPPDAGVHTRRSIFRVGEPADLKGNAYFATWSPRGGRSSVVFTVAKTAVEALGSSPDDLRDPRVSIVKPTEVATLSVQRKGMDDLGLTRDKGDYAFVQPGPGYPAGYDASTDFIQSLTTLEGSGYVHDFQPAGDPTVIVSMTLNNTDGAERLAFYPSPDGKPGDLVAVRGDEPVGYKIPAAKAKLLRRPLLSLRDRTVLDLVTLKPDMLTLSRGDAVTYQFTHDTGDQWSLKNQDSFEADAFGQLRASLSPLVVEQWIRAKGELPEVDSDDERPTLTIHATQGKGKDGGKDRSQTKTLTLTMDPKTRHAHLSGLAGVFTVSTKLANQLTAEYRDRSLLALTSDDIQRVAVTEGDRTRTFGVGDDGAARLFDQLTGLEVTRYLPAKPTDMDEPNAGEPPTRFKITTKANKDFALVVMAAKGKDQPVTGHLGDRWFTVAADKAEALTAAARPSPPGSPGPRLRQLGPTP